MDHQLYSVTEDAFSPFGDILEFKNDVKRDFSIVVQEKEPGWRLAVFRYDNHTIDRLERHPTSRESFEPLEGATVLLVAESASPEDWRAFYLDKPVCLHKNVWHQVLALTPQASVKITENLEVDAEFYKLPKPVAVTVQAV